MFGHRTYKSVCPCKTGQVPGTVFGYQRCPKRGIFYCGLYLNESGQWRVDSDIKIELGKIELVWKDKVDEYLEKYNPVQLRWNSLTKNTNPEFAITNFGQSKG